MTGIDLVRSIINVIIEESDKLINTFERSMNWRVKRSNLLFNYLA